MNTKYEECKEFCRQHIKPLYKCGRPTDYKETLVYSLAIQGLVTIYISMHIKEFDQVTFLPDSHIRCDLKLKGMKVNSTYVWSYAYYDSNDEKRVEIDLYNLMDEDLTI